VWKAAEKVCLKCHKGCTVLNPSDCFNKNFVRGKDGVLSCICLHRAYMGSTSTVSTCWLISVSITRKRKNRRKAGTTPRPSRAKSVSPAIGRIGEGRWGNAQRNRTQAATPERGNSGAPGKQQSRGHQRHSRISDRHPINITYAASTEHTAAQNADRRTGSRRIWQP
jgi:hypothetical protein